MRSGPIKGYERRCSGDWDYRAGGFWQYLYVSTPPYCLQLNKQTDGSGCAFKDLCWDRDRQHNPQLNGFLRGKDYKKKAVVIVSVQAQNHPDIQQKHKKPGRKTLKSSEPVNEHDVVYLADFVHVTC